MWQPIETAPNDGKPILIFGGMHERPTVAPADGEWWRSQISKGKLPRVLPTHWMPIPEPPVA